MAQEPAFKPPVFDEVANYPSECRSRFLALCQRRQIASPGAIAHFVNPEIDECLDSYLLWLSIYSE